MFRGPLFQIELHLLCSFQVDINKWEIMHPFCSYDLSFSKFCQFFFLTRVHASCASKISVDPILWDQGSQGLLLNDSVNAIMIWRGQYWSLSILFWKKFTQNVMVDRYRRSHNQCSKLPPVRRPEADKNGAGLTTFLIHRSCWPT